MINFQPQFVNVLTSLFDAPAVIVPHDSPFDAAAEVGGHTLLAHFKSDATAPRIRAGIHQVKRYSNVAFSGQIPLLVVPFMTERGKQHCKAENVSWMDLSGNASIRGMDLIVRTSGQSNQFKKRGRPRNPFALKSSRVVRLMLANPDRSFRQHELAEAANISAVLTSHAVSGLIHDGFLERLQDRSVRLIEPDQLLAAWKKAYSLDGHTVLRGHTSAGSGRAGTEQLWSILWQHGVEHAFTGLSAAWMIAPMSMYRISSVYLKEQPSPELLSALRFEEESRGANTWLIIPNDDGVFWGTKEYESMPVVSPLQVLLDLKDHPERSEEAAEEIQKKFFPWADQKL